MTQLDDQTGNGEIRQDACPACESSRKSKAYTAHWRDTEVPFLRCLNCGTFYPEKLMPIDELLAFYDQDEYWGKKGDTDSYMYGDYLALKEQMLQEARRNAATIASLLGCDDLSGMTVLDVGCGCGFSSAAFQEAGAEVTGIEPSERMSRIAREEVGVPCITGTIEDLVSDDRRYDIVVSWGTSMNFREPIKAYDAMQALLVDGGTLAFDYFNLDSPLACMTAQKRKKGVHVTLGPTDRGIRTLLGRVGFKDIALRSRLPRVSISFIGTQLDSAILKQLGSTALGRRILLPTPLPGLRLVIAKKSGP